jgi:RNA polymerase sigma factor (sigma-70 family)
MATGQGSEILLHLRRAALRDGAGLTDGQLLENYLSRQDQAALAALVHRHGPMVWGVCRRVLPSYHDAEDAFQAAFLVLVRRAASIASRELLAKWLYGVAHQTALKARATAAKRKGRERQLPELPDPTVAEQAPWPDLRPLLDEELSHLPDRYRTVLVLCVLGGKTRKEAAEQLGIPEGTVAGRLARARALLAKRLTRRGVTMSGAGLAAVMSANLASAGVPSAVVAPTIKAASLWAAGQAAVGVVSVRAAALAEGVLKTMTLKKLKIIAAVLFVVAVVGVGVGSALHWRAAATQAAPLPTKGEKAGARHKKRADQANQQGDAREKEQGDKGGVLLFTTTKDKQIMVLALLREGEFEIVADRLLYEEDKKRLVADGEARGKVFLSIRRRQRYFGAPAKAAKPEEVRCDKLVFDRQSGRIEITSGLTTRLVRTRERK